MTGFEIGLLLGLGVRSRTWKVLPSFLRAGGAVVAFDVVAGAESLPSWTGLN